MAVPLITLTGGCLAWGHVALLVATQNHAPPEVNAVILAYLLVSVFAIVPYVAWRRRAGARAS